jgi:hypothetical protein
MTFYLDGTLFNCFYSVFDAVRAAGIREDFNWAVLLWNILFNFGFQYTNLKNVFTFFFYDLNKNGGDKRKWYTIGLSAGDFLVRFLYSPYRSATFLPF